VNEMYTAKESKAVEMNKVNEMYTANELKAVEVNEAVKKESHALMNVAGTICDKPVRILVDSGATNNLCRQNLSSNVVAMKKVSIQGFDGRSTPQQSVNEISATIKFDGWTFTDQKFTEWDLGSKKFDVILGKPWFYQYNPTIDWRLNKVLEVNTSVLKYKDKPGWIMKITSVDEVKEENHEIPAVVQQVLDEYKDVFPNQLPNTLPPHRAIEFDLNMKADAKPQYRPPFRLSQVEQASLDKFVKELEEKGWIQLSTSNWVSNIFGVPKKNSEGKIPSRCEWLRTATADTPIRWVLDYRHVNSQTEIPKIPLPNIEDLFDRMHGSTTFTKIDLASGYHQMLVVPTARKYTAFRTHREVYEWVVAPMGMAGMPGIWSRLMRHLFDKLSFVVVYMDDICIFSTTAEDHARHLAAVCEVLRREKVYARPSKCSFAVDSVDFLGHTISKFGLQVDKKKVRVIEKWPEPTNRKELLSFLGLAGYYRKFIAGYAKVVMPLSELVKPSSTWKWESHHTKAFVTIKLALQQAPVLSLPNFTKSFIVTTDASGRCCGAVLSQLNDKNEDKPIAFLSKKFGPHEVNWPAHEQELYAIKLALTKWRHFLHGSRFDIYTDNSACKWFMETPVLTPKLTRWLDFFSSFDFVLHHRPGKLNVVADALSRIPSIKPSFNNKVHVHTCEISCTNQRNSLERHFVQVNEFMELNVRDIKLLTNSPFSGEKLPQSIKPMIKQQYVVNHATRISFSSVRMSDEMKDRFRNGYASDPKYLSIADNETFVEKDELIFLRTEDQVWRLCVPNDEVLRTDIIAMSHDSNIAAHPGIRRTQLSVAQWYYWEKMHEDIKLYVLTCETCNRFKTSSLRANGKMIPIEAPEECWHTISMDWITGLPVSRGFDAILTVVDKLSKRAKYIATQSTADVPTTAKLFFDEVIRHHGLPAVIISDRDSKFTSSFWKSLMTYMGIKQSMTTAGRAQADGATERQNRTLEDSLRCQVSYLGEDWADHLATIEYAHQGLVQASTGVTPFEVDTGRKLRNPVIDSVFLRNEMATNFAENRKKILKNAIDNLKKAQARQKEYYDKKRSNVEFHEGDLVLLATRTLPLKHAQQRATQEKPKLVPRYIGPFEIIAEINPNAMKLKLPRSMSRIHNVFNVDRLKPYRPSPNQFASRPIPKAVPAIVDNTGETLYIVEELLRQRHRNGKREFLVKWHGWPESEATWEPESNIKQVSHFKSLLKTLKEKQRGRQDVGGECNVVSYETLLNVT